MRQSGGCRTSFYFDESGAVYICNEYVTFGDENAKMVLRFTDFTVIYLPIRYN